MRLIDADALIKWLNDTYCDTSKRLWNYNQHVMAMDMIDILENYPTIEERKHGCWVTGENEDDGDFIIKCSICGKRAPTDGDYRYYLSNYCPHCGATMDEEAKND